MSQDEKLGVWALAVGQTLGFAALIYIFGAILLSLEAGSGWGRAELALGPTLGLLVSAALAPLSGRLVDRGFGGALLAGAAALGALCLILLSQVNSLALWLALWAVIGLAQAGSLYETCFAFLTRRLGSHARSAIIRVTLVAGFASTIAFPLGAYAGHGLGWRGALLTFGLVQLVVTVPANLVGVAWLRRGERRGGEGGVARKGAIRAALHRPEFWLLAGLFGLILGNHTMLSTFALPVLAIAGPEPDLLFWWPPRSGRCRWRGACS
ncbi:MAG: MFS transporter [Albidovulum sp.]